ncbi:uncharacterized protein B0J16DRAFT_377003 [Fusarium flagelliforme]|uniref:uncharacterized protein n=1 Tax=Fusarium flagelliforme TaxID=2675880 RepID=UPI001E8E5B3D|nr:uncharacterized protein B0J16DRAFT_377003 [Fusarium flagelliforme]KAH7196541.1 hypothetical protein B0J16DRAFT_377003 [Fusarium flagelliforme]
MDTSQSFRLLPYCCFCLFELEAGDKAIRPVHISEVRAPDTPTTIIFEYQPWVFNPQDPQSVPPRRWKRSREAIPIAHLACCHEWSETFKRRPWGLVRYDFKPPSSDLLRRRLFLLKGLGSKTPKNINKIDLQQQARLGVRSLLDKQRIPQQVIDANSGCVHFVVDLRQPIWGIGVAFEGLKYMSYLSNKQLPDFERVLARSDGSLGKVTYLSNHLGVGTLYLDETRLPSPIKECPGVWWSCFRASERRSFLRGITDGLKIRDLQLVESPQAVGRPPIRWSIPPTGPIWFVDLDARAHGTPHFKLMDCGRPGITAYSACMIDGDLVDLRCHVQGEGRDEVSTYYNEGGGDRPHAVWLYFPVQDDERVFEVWRRRKKPHSCRDIPMLRTNKGRVFVLGTHPNDTRLPVTLDRLTSFPSSTNAKFWYSCLGGCVDHLAFVTEDRRHDKNDPCALLVGPAAVLSSSGVGNQYFYTMAKLEDVVRVVPCQAWAPGSTGIVGLLFIYSDGHREAVGQIRLDYLLPSLSADPAGDMWLGVRQLSYGFVVDAIRLIPSAGKTVYGGNSSEDGLNWHRIEWRGRLEWLVWYGSCFISHQQQTVPPGDLGSVLEAQGGREWENEVEDRKPIVSP